LYHILAIMTKFGVEKTTLDILKELAQKHKVIRKQAGLTQSALAERSGVSLGSIKRFENTGRISLESLVQSAQILNRMGDFDLILNINKNMKDIDKLFSDRTRI
jgi:transcriptional regulator with XRE-family HTH domain